MTMFLKHLICNYIKFFFFQLDFTCKEDKDCHKGYCEKDKTHPAFRQCVCLPGSTYKEDCSFSGCKLNTKITEN